MKTHVMAKLTTLAIALSAPLAAQSYPVSERGSVMQHVANTTFTITYGRPSARGRTLFGDLVPWDKVWHPGADSATRLEVDHDVQIEGQLVKAGEYSLWLIPREHAAWTLIFSRAAHVFHNRYPGTQQDAYRLDLPADSLSFVETLEIGFPTVTRDEAVLRIHWGATGVSAHIRAAYQP